MYNVNTKSNIVIVPQYRPLWDIIDAIYGDDVDSGWVIAYNKALLAADYCYNMGEPCPAEYLAEILEASDINRYRYYNVTADLIDTIHGLISYLINTLSILAIPLNSCMVVDIDESNIVLERYDTRGY